VFSERLIALLDDILAVRAPNAGRFCGYCYHPLPVEREVCPHCGHGVADRRPVEAIPHPVIEMHKRRRGREGLIVRSIAWGGLTVGVCLALVPVAFGGLTWWSAVLFFGFLALFYLLSANLANSVGDSLGYSSGQAIVRKRWGQFLEERDGPVKPPAGKA
jgi:hypothetical protein